MKHTFTDVSMMKPCRCDRTLLTGRSFVRRYIFPGTYCPTMVEISRVVRDSTNSRLSIDQAINVGSQYPLTLRAWKNNFLQKFHSDIRPVLEKDMTPRETESFRRMFEVRPLSIRLKQHLSARYTNSWCSCTFLILMLHMALAI